MPVATIPGVYGRATTVEVFEPAQTQDDGEVLLDRFELGPNEVREGYVTPSPYTSFRYREESIGEIDAIQQSKGASGDPKLLPHMQAEGEAGQKRLGEVTPALDAVDEYKREQGIELPQERAQRWQDDVEAVKGGNLSIEESSERVLRGRVNRTQEDMVAVGDEGGSAGQSASSGKSKKAAQSDDKAAEARKKAAEQRRQHEG
jgi:hypothetical protein